MGTARKIMSMLAVATVTLVVIWTLLVPGIRALVEMDREARTLFEQKYKATLLCHDGDTVVCSREYQERCVAWRFCLPGKAGFF